MNRFEKSIATSNWPDDMVARYLPVSDWYVFDLNSDLPPLVD